MGSVSVAAGSRVYLDANVYIYAAESNPVLPGVLTIFRRLGRGELVAITSALTLAEVLVKPFRTGNAVLEAAYLTQIVTGINQEVVGVSRDVLIRAATIRGQVPTVKLPDAIHAATAELSGCDVFLTNDTRLRGVRGLPIVLVTDLA